FTATRELEMPGIALLRAAPCAASAAFFPAAETPGSNFTSNVFWSNRCSCGTIRRSDATGVFAAGLVPRGPAALTPTAGRATRPAMTSTTPLHFPLPDPKRVRFLTRREGENTWLLAEPEGYDGTRWPSPRRPR